jgi:hypothetical protein
MRIWILGLGLCLCLMQPVEIEPGLPLNRGGCGEIEDRPRAFLDRAQWPHPCPPHHACVHVSCGVKAGDRNAGTLERSPEIDREHDLSQLALTIGSSPPVAAGQHYVAKVDRLLSGRRDIHDPRRRAVLDKRQ